MADAPKEKRGPKGFAPKRGAAPVGRNTSLAVTPKAGPSLFRSVELPFAGEKVPKAVRGAAPPKDSVLDPRPAPVAPVALTAPAVEAPKRNNKTRKVLSAVQAKAAPTEKAPVKKGVPEEVKRQIRTLKKRQEEEEEKNPYVEEEVIPYVPTSRSAFRRFLVTTYAPFQLPVRYRKDINPNACSQMTLQTYKYQAFVREYMRMASPYRGVLVYHGLGSGKTCTSIAAAEALFSQSGRKIIVLTPIALMENFLNELMFCGFKHFRLKNMWVKFPLTPESALIAKNVLEIPEAYLKRVMRLKKKDQRVFWMPDLTKSEAEANYESLSDWERASIRGQLYEILKNRITLIGYTGMTRKALMKLVLEKDAWDDAVIVIDEVHNLTRLMRGKLDKYLKDPGVPVAGKGKPTKVSVSYEPVTVDKWQPKLLPSDGEDDYIPDYERAFLFYRLLTQARRSKIIALSGTPIVNFPEELGILGNILHGYMDSVTFKVTLKEGDSRTQRELFAELCRKHPRIDFYDVTTDGAKIQVFYNLLPDGYTKVFKEDGTMEGVLFDEALDEDPFLQPRDGEPDGTNAYIRNVQDSVEAEVVAKGYKVESLVFKALPLFPPTVEQFRETFLHQTPAEPAEGMTDEQKQDLILKHSLTFMKRMSGHVSYYKGGDENLMPRVTLDVTVPCPMSAHQIPMYATARALERQQDESAGKKTSWQEANELAGSEAKSTSYRFRSRAICNFAFPAYLPRPFPVKSKDFKIAAAVDDLLVGDAVVEDTTEEVRELLADTEEPTGEEAVAEAEKAEETEEAEAEAEAEDSRDEALNRAILEETEQKLQEAYEASVGSAEEADAEEAELKRREALKAQILNPSVPYLDRVQIALRELFAKKEDLFTIPEDGSPCELDNLSPKFKDIYKNILASRGSSLVYSQFKTLEGVGILGLVLQANGFARIVLEGADTDLRLSAESAKSLRENPEQPRYIEYSGGDTKRRRQVFLDLFNMRIDKLPAKIATLFKDNPLTVTKNQKGEVCKVFMITGAGAEGLSLKNVRTVHVMEPYWNKVRTDQVKGRAVRICSHADLPWEERTVEIYTYLAKLEERPGVKLDQTLLLQDEGKTSDEHIYNVSRAKEDVSNAFLLAMKQSAIDCELNRPDNEPIQCYVQEFTSLDEFSTDPRIEIDITREGAVKRGTAAAAVKDSVRAAEYRPPPLVPGARPSVAALPSAVPAVPIAPVEKPKLKVLKIKGVDLFVAPPTNEGRTFVYKVADKKQYNQKKAVPLYEQVEKGFIPYKA